MVDDEIIVMLPRVALLGRITSLNASITIAEFHARAWRLANEKARELGWIV